MFGRWPRRSEEGFLGIFLRPHEVHVIGDIGAEGFRIVSRWHGCSVEKRQKSSQRDAIERCGIGAADMRVACVPIPGTRKRKRLEENLAVAALRPGEDAMQALTPLAAAVQGVAV
ncbi:hypothetical protein [Labrys monachus]|uniref:Uncharacterized protein n=1 Tax=Labrys monachus TaxID=217067 RepID=A0ABU0FGG2_9HYPH|nr:hypothetical protein [Labrys monachus]MDQ0393688.1 hypothetical protein [Labrys monachus]